jgi:polyhydroxyalkanoate synthase
VTAAAGAARSVAAALTTRVGRLGRRLTNGVRYATKLDPPTVAASPRELVWSGEYARLWHYQGPGPAHGPPVLIVHSLVSDSRILDLRPGHSFVGHLRDGGLDVFLLEWRAADERSAQRTLADYVDDDIPRAVREVCTATAATDVTLMGYCFGGILALVATARHRDLPVRNLITMATAVDFTETGVIANLLGGHGIDPTRLLDETGNLPASTVARGIRLLRPTADLRSLATLWQNLDDDDRVAGLRAVDDWLRDQVPFPGSLFVECVGLFVHDNALVNDTVSVAGEAVTLRAVTCPFLAVVADDDFVVPVQSALAAPGLVGSTDTTLLRLPAGHIAFVAGSRRVGSAVRQILEWLVAHGDLHGEPGTRPD